MVQLSSPPNNIIFGPCCCLFTNHRIKKCWKIKTNVQTVSFIFTKVSIKKEKKKKPKQSWKWKSLSRVRLFATPWTIQSREFSRPEYWSGLPFPSPGDLPNPGIELRSPALQADSLPAELFREPHVPVFRPTIHWRNAFFLDWYDNKNLPL